MSGTRMQGELNHGELHYQAVFNQTFQLMAVLDPSGRVLEMNETMRQLGPSPESDALQIPVWSLELWEEECRPLLRQAVEAAAVGVFFREELSLRASTDELLTVDTSLKPIRDSSGEVGILVFEARDITQHKVDQELLMQSQKMEVLGQFASGIAHDFNNLLTVIAGNLELFERRFEGSETELRRIGNALNAVFQGRTLTDRILAFARKQQLEPGPVDLKTLIVEAIELSQSGLDENTALESEVEPGLWPAWVDPAQLQTALLNLLINARDAMPNGGSILARAANFSMPADAAGRRPDLPDGEYIVLSVRDEGDGIPAEVIDKVTDPFFTTKAPGEGSGLGLSMVSGFVKQSGGDLVITSSEGRGTKVALYLPRSPLPVVSRATSAAMEGAERAARVLVVEDVPQVRETAVSMLLDLGFEVVEAASGDDAMALLNDEAGRFDLLITDIVMPGELDGRALAGKAKSILPGLRILYTSGNAEKIVSVRPKMGDYEDFLPKPYAYRELAQKVGRLLARDSAQSD